MVQGNITPRLIHLIYCLSALILEYHHLEFDGNLYQQIKGSAIGSNFFVVCACLFLCYLEKLQARRENSPKLLYYKRYIEDAFGVWEGDEASFRHYLSQYALDVQQHAKITTCISKHKMDFLDVTISMDEHFYAIEKLSTRCFQKKHNQYQYLPFMSCHPRHQKFTS